MKVFIAGEVCDPISGKGLTKASLLSEGQFGINLSSHTGSHLGQPVGVIKVGRNKNLFTPTPFLFTIHSVVRYTV